MQARGEAGSGSMIGQPAPSGWTHFVSGETDLLDAPGGNVIRRLPANSTVNKVDAEGSFALIARDTRIIGYVKKGKLVE